MMEHLHFKGRASQEELGRGLAKMHLAEPRVSTITQIQALVREQINMVRCSSIMPGCLATLPGRRLLIYIGPVQDQDAKAGKFGFPVDNTIGGNPQPNGWMDNWVDFFRERRLMHMLRLVNDSRLTDMGERIAKNMHKMFKGVEVSGL